MRVFRVGIVGFGASAGYFHLPAVAAVASLKVIAAFDPVAAQRDEAIGHGIANVRDSCGLATGVRELGLDVVIVSSPSSEHLGQSLEALEAGAHVVVEKPAAFDGAGFSELLQVALRCDRCLVPFHNRRFDGDHVAVVEAVRAGVVGRVLRVDLAATRAGHWTDYATPAFDPSWRMQRRWGGGVWNDWGPHLLDQLLRVVDRGVPQRVEAWMHPQGGAAGESMTVAQLDWGDCMGRILISAHEAAPTERCRVVGTKGTIVARGSDESGVVEMSTDSGSTSVTYATSPLSGAALYGSLAVRLAGGAGDEIRQGLEEAQNVYDLLGEVRRRATQ